MKLIEAKNYEELSSLAAWQITEEIIRKPNLVLGLATGSSPLGIYRCLSREYQAGTLSLKHVTGFNLDEYAGLAKEHPQSFYYYLKTRLADVTDLPLQKLHVPDGMARDMEQECQAYEEAIQRSGGIDFQLLGLGGDGHIGFNEPCDYFPDQTHLTALKAESIAANAKDFPSIADVPVKAVTMGIGTIMRAKKILMVVSGSSKAEILCKMLNGPVCPQVPASILRFHLNCTVIADRDALTALGKRE